MSGNTTKERHPFNLNVSYSSRPVKPRNGASN